MKDTSRNSVPYGSLLGIVGWTLFLSALGVGITLIVHDLVWGHANPYTGVVTYLLVPMFLTAGLGLVVLSWLLGIKRRSRHSSGENLTLHLDLDNPSHRQRVLVFGLGAMLFACISAVGSYRSYHFTESTEFCGMTCHQVMKPEYVTYHNSPHAKVDCVECHIGAGADWYVKSKMSGLRQVFAYTLNTYHLPIETPIRDLRPARETCEECHWPEKFSGNLEKTFRHTLRDEENTPYTVRLLLKVGGRQGSQSSGIHWHVSSGHTIEYIATDRNRMDIPWVRMTGPTGKTTVFKTEECPPGIDTSTQEIRTMDCIDCHNRPSHIFNDPLKMVDRAIAVDEIPTTLPNVKGTVMDLLDKTYPSTGAAIEAIGQGLSKAYLTAGEIPDATRTQAVAKAQAAVQQIYSDNFFPEMGVDWTTHPDFIGHFRWKGCYRCHDGNKKSETGEVISHACANCHDIIGQGEGLEKASNPPYGIGEFNHPMDMGPLEPGANCTDCHAAPSQSDYMVGHTGSVHAQR